MFEKSGMRFCHTNIITAVLSLKRCWQGETRVRKKSKKKIKKRGEGIDEKGVR